jgi:hypothetical protein
LPICISEVHTKLEVHPLVQVKFTRDLPKCKSELETVYLLETLCYPDIKSSSTSFFYIPYTFLYALFYIRYTRCNKNIRALTLKQSRMHVPSSPHLCTLRVINVQHAHAHTQHTHTSHTPIRTQMCAHTHTFLAPLQTFLSASQAPRLVTLLDSGEASELLHQCYVYMSYGTGKHARPLRVHISRKACKPFGCAHQQEGMQALWVCTSAGRHARPLGVHISRKARKPFGCGMCPLIGYPIHGHACCACATCMCPLALEACKHVVRAYLLHDCSCA